MDYIEASNVCKQYKLRNGNSKTVIDRASFDFQKGDFVLFKGASGSGKTTLLFLLGCLLTPDKGRILFDNCDITQCSEAIREDLRRNEIGIVFQDFNLLNHLNVLDNIFLSIRAKERISKEEAKLRSLEILERAGLGDKQYQNPRELSGGEKQRVSIVRALIKKPSLFILDEPTSNLDPMNRDIIFKEIVDYWELSHPIVLVASHEKKFWDIAQKKVCFCDDRIKIQK